MTDWDCVIKSQQQYCRRIILPEQTLNTHCFKYISTKTILYKQDKCFLTFCAKLHYCSKVWVWYNIIIKKQYNITVYTLFLFQIDVVYNPLKSLKILTNPKVFKQYCKFAQKFCKRFFQSNNIVFARNLYIFKTVCFNVCSGAIILLLYT